jgi:cell division protein FtsW
MSVPGAAAVRERMRMGVDARLLVVVTMVLQAAGLATLYSASAMVAMNAGNSSAHFLVRQLTGVMAGIIVFAVAAKMDAERWRGWAWPLMGVTLVLMLITVLPFTTSISPRVNGSRRWVNFGFLFQASELGKLAVVAWTAMLVVKKGDRMRRLLKGLLPFLAVVGVLSLLAVLEPDLSSAMMFTLLMAIVLFTGGVRIGHVVVLGIIAIPLLYNQVERLQYAALRMSTFFNPGDAPLSAGHQLTQSLIAVGSGGAFGVGFGQGRQQDLFLPYPYSDFIGSIVGEEWGFVGMLVLILLFALYTVAGMRIARRAATPFQSLFAVGLTAATAVTALLHIGVVIGLLPTTGLTLPFFSWGRSNLVLSYLMTGILVSIGSTRERVYGDGATNPVISTA